MLEEAIRVRNEVATLLGYDSWAAYVVEKRMAKTRDAVDGFLRDLGPRLDAKARADMDVLSDAKNEHVGDTHINIWDWWFYTHAPQDGVRRRRLRGRELLPADACLDGLFLVTQELLGIRYEPAPDAPKWHDDVQAFDIFDADGSRALRALLHGPVPAAEQVRPRGRLHAGRRPQAARRHVPEAGQRHRRELHEALGGRAVAASPQRGRDVLPRVRPHPAPDAHALRLTWSSAAPRPSATSSKRRRRCSSTGSGTATCCAASRGTTRPASRCPTTCSTR